LGKGSPPQIPFGETTHLGRFVDSHGGQASAEEDALQMSGPVPDLKDSLPLDEGQHAHDPVFPAIERNSRGDEIVGKRELVIEQAEKESQERLHREAILWTSAAVRWTKK
jgi:hypothetical protein